MDPGQEDNLDRVTERIGWAVLAFCADKPYGQTFFADELRRFVRSKVGLVAPGSPDRILRLLRQKGKLDYFVVSRSESLYMMLWVGKPEENAA